MNVSSANRNETNRNRKKTVAGNISHPPIAYTHPANSGFVKPYARLVGSSQSTLQNRAMNGLEARIKADKAAQSIQFIYE